MPKADQVSVFLPNSPGELKGLCGLLKDNDINILAMSIQNARDYVEELFRARERSGRRIVLAESYRGVLRESAEYSVIRMVAEPSERVEAILTSAEYAIDIAPVLCLYLEHKAGVLLEVAERFSSKGINIDYVYGSAMGEDQRSLFVCHVPDIEEGLSLFNENGEVP